MSATLSSFTVPPQSLAHLRRLCVRVAEWLQAAATGALPLLARDLEDAAAGTADARDRAALTDLAARLRLRPAERAGRVRQTFEECVQLRLDRENRGGAFGVAQPSAASVELARRVQVEGAATHSRYAARLDHLLAECGTMWSDRTHPLTIEAMAAALHAALADLMAGDVARLRLAPAANRHFSSVLLEVLEAAERLLVQMGYTGGHAGRRPAGADGPAGASSSAMRDPSVDHLQTLVTRSERAAATLGTSALAGNPGSAHLHGLPALHPVLDAERDAVAFAHSVGALPYSREARAGFFANVRTRLREANAPATQVAVVDLVAAMFDYLVAEDRVSLAARPLLWRLQLPVLTLSLLDAGYLGEDPRSLRRLLEHFGAISVHHADEITRGSELHRRLETVVRAIEIVASALQMRSGVMAQQVQKEFARAARSVGQMIEHIAREHRTLEVAPGRRNRRNYVRRPGPELEHEATARVRRLLDERLRRHAPPESVHRFLRDLWLRHLRTAMLRDGGHSAAFQVSLGVVDDLLWSLDEHGQPFSRGELAQRIPPLIRLMTRGVHEIGAREEEYKAFFDELFLIHLRRMQKRDREYGAAAARTGNGAAAIGTVLQRPLTGPGAGAEEEPGDKSGPCAAGKENAGGDAGIRATASGQGSDGGETGPEAPAAGIAGTDSGERLAGILESLDLADLPAAPVRRELDADSAVSGLARGDWIELSTRDGAGSWVKVAWINRRRTVILLLRHPDRRASSLRMDELRDRLARGRAFLIRAEAESIVRSIGNTSEKEI